MIDPNNETTHKAREFVMRVTIAEHLGRLQAQESKRPPAIRRTVPNMTDLARAVGVSRATLYNFDNGRTRKINIDVLTEIINYLNQCGLDTDIPDLLTLYPAELA